MSDAKMDIELKKVQTPEFRVSFPHVFEPHAFAEQKAQYSLTMLFSKKTDLKLLKKAAFNACVERWGSDKAKWPKNLDMPFRDGDAPNKKGNKHPEGYAGCIFVVAKSKKRKPGVIGPTRDESGDFPILETEAEFYAGCYARANLLAYSYAHLSGTTGVGFNLQGIQKLRDGKEFSGHVDIQSSFDEVVSTSDDESSYKASDDDDTVEMGF